MTEGDGSVSFELHGAVYLYQSTGTRAANLDDLLRLIREADAQTLFLHTQMPRLRSSLGEDTPTDDLSAWVSGVVQDREIGERLAFATHTTSPSIEEVRAALVQVLEAVPERTRIERDAPHGGEFEPLRFDAVSVPTGLHVETPEDLVEALGRSDRTVWFHHLIEEPWLSGPGSALVEWVRATGDRKLADALAGEAASGYSVAESRTRILRRWQRSHIGRRVAEASDRGGLERSASGREVVGNLARRLAGRKRP